MTLRSQSGFTVVEVLVAALIGLMMVAAAGNLGLNLFHKRASYDSLSAATSLAERQFELLRNIQNPSADTTNFSNGTHTATNSPLTQSGTAGGPYNVRWIVADPFPSALQGTCASGSGLKKITIQVSHTSDPSVNVELVTHYKVC